MKCPKCHWNNPDGKMSCHSCSAVLCEPAQATPSASFAGSIAERSSEKPYPDPHEKNYTAQDMRSAFQHGRKYEMPESDWSDRDYGDVDEKHWPFWEWLKATAF